MAFSSAQLTVPPGFPELLQGLAKEVLRNQPKDIVSFAYEHFAKMVDDRKAQEAHQRAADIEATTDSLRPNKNVIIPEKKIEDQGEAEDEEELPALDSFNQEEVSAITKIQSGFRGMQARKQVKQQVEEPPATTIEDTAVANNEEEEELPDLESFDQNEVSAITKIQSGFRGMQARKQVQEMKTTEDEVKPEQEEEEELPDLNSFDDGEVQAISKIQAGFRGMKARNEVKQMKAEPEAAPVEEEEELPDLNSFDQSEVNAITKIQSGFRGMKARKEVSDKKSSQTPADSVLSPRGQELPPSTAASQAASQAVMPLSPRPESSQQQVNIEKIADSTTNNETQAEEELPDLQSFDDSEVSAITKIQSGFRGMQARKEVNELKKKDSDVANDTTSLVNVEPSAPTEATIKEEGGQDEEEEELPALDSFDKNEVQAITKIQAGFRGMQARKEVKDKVEEAPAAAEENAQE